MSTQAINRAVKEALGERGSISFPLMPSLQPVLVVDALPALGGAAIPWGFVLTSTAVAGQRSCVELNAPVGSIIAVDYSRCSAAGEAADVRVTSAQIFAINQVIGVADTRRWGPFDPLSGSSTGSGILCAATGAQVAGSPGARIDRITNSEPQLHPCFIGPGHVLWQGTVDNTGITVIARGRLWFRDQ